MGELLYSIDNGNSWQTQTMDKDEIYLKTSIPTPDNNGGIKYYYKVRKTDKGEVIYDSDGEPFVRQIFMPVQEMELLESNPSADFLLISADYMILNSTSRLIDNQKYLEAIPKLRNFLRKFPKSMEAWGQLGAAELHSNRFNDAWISLNQALKNCDYKTSDQIKEVTFSIKRKIISAMYKICIVCEYLHNHPAGLLWAKKMAEIEPDNYQAWYSLADFYKFNKEDKKAVECYEKATGLQPLSITAWNLYGDFHLKRNQYSEAEKCYDKAIDLWNKKGTNSMIREVNPDAIRTAPEAWLGKGLIFHHKKKFSKAKKAFQEGNKIDRRNPNVNAAWSNVEFEKGNYQQAEMLAKQSIEVLPVKPKAWVVLGKTSLKRGMKDQAIYAFSQGLKHGAIYPCAENLTKLVRDVPEAFHILPKEKEDLNKMDFSLRNWGLLGNFYSNSNDLTHARICYEKILEKSPQHLFSFNYLAVISSKEWKLEEAIKYNQLLLDGLEQSNEMIPNQREIQILAYNNLGLTYHKKFEFDKAEIAFKNAIKLDPTQFQAHMNLGRQYYIINDFEKALNEFKYVKTDHPQTREALRYYYRIIRP